MNITLLILIIGYVCISAAEEGTTLVLYAIAPRDAVSAGNACQFVSASVAAAPLLRPVGDRADIVLLTPPGADDDAWPLLLGGVPNVTAAAGAGTATTTIRQARVASVCKHGWGAHVAYLASVMPSLPHDTSSSGSTNTSIAAAAAAALARLNFTTVVFASSAMAGPFLPKYASKRVHWLAPLTARLGKQKGTGRQRVGLVAPLISCEQTRGGGGGNMARLGGRKNSSSSSSTISSSSTRQVPHPADPNFVAFDAAALRELLLTEAANGGEMFGCHATARHAQHYAASAAAEALLANGWGLDCLALRYQGIDWADRRNWRCNGGINPVAADRLYDGIAPDPLETMFAPRTAPLLVRRDPAAVRAGRLQAWLAAAASSPAAALAAAARNNRAAAAAEALRLRRLEADARGGAACFDAAYYAAAHADVAAALGGSDNSSGLAAAARYYGHYESYGAAEGRAHRWLCRGQWEAAAVAPLRRVARAVAAAEAGGAPACEGELARLSAGWGMDCQDLLGNNNKGRPQASL